jgi:hypothetical protein
MNKNETPWKIALEAPSEEAILLLAHDRVLWRELPHPLSILGFLAELNNVWGFTHAHLVGVTRITLTIYGPTKFADDPKSGQIEQTKKIKSLIKKLVREKNKVTTKEISENDLAIYSETTGKHLSNSLIGFSLQDVRPLRKLLAVRIDCNLFGKQEVCENVKLLTN